jgi:hypothetical protein
MRAVVVYESMYGNTHVVADHIAEGLGGSMEVSVLPVGPQASAAVATADFLVVGGPTHVHGMSSSTSRKGAVADLEKHPELTLDPDAEGPGLRDWFRDLEPSSGTRAAAFDTRIDAPPALTGRASKGIARRLRHHGFTLVEEPESFLVDKESELEPGEADRARGWGESLASALVPADQG